MLLCATMLWFLLFVSVVCCVLILVLFLWFSLVLLIGNLLLLLFSWVHASFLIFYVGFSATMYVLLFVLLCYLLPFFVILDLWKRSICFAFPKNDFLGFNFVVYIDHPETVSLNAHGCQWMLSPNALL